MNYWIITVVIFKQWLVWSTGICEEIELMECLPPDYPIMGGYGPRNDFYLPGDSIHYFCEKDTYIGGNYFRICMDNGDWSGDTPVCDTPATFASVRQSSTAVPDSENAAARATDGLRNTCSTTSQVALTEPTWTGILEAPGEVLRVMLFLPKGPVWLEVRIVRSDGTELICGTIRKYIATYEWTFQNCPGPNNTGAIAIKITSLSGQPLQLCEIVAHTLTSPTCVDPHFIVDNGRLAISRKEAKLVCNPGYTGGRLRAIECVRTGVWNRKQLYCQERTWELEENTGSRPEIPEKPSDNERISNSGKTSP